MIVFIISFPSLNSYSVFIPIFENNFIILFTELGVSNPKALPIISFLGGILWKITAIFLSSFFFIPNFAQFTAILDILFTLSSIGINIFFSPYSSLILSYVQHVTEIICPSNSG